MLRLLREVRYPRHRAGKPSDGHPAPAPQQALDLDADRIRRARAGDETAVAELYAEHRPVALRVASRSCRPTDVDDVVAEAFTRVLDMIGRGGGPQTSFRAYLLTAVRHAAADIGRAESRCVPAEITDDLADRSTAPVREDAGSEQQVESHLLARALTTLPARWQLVVWWSAVEDRSMSEIGAELGLNANAAAALAFRAREGLRNAYLAQHLADATDRGCAAWRPQLPALARGRLTGRLGEQVTAHVDGCHPCADAVETLRSVLLHAAS